MTGLLDDLKPGADEKKLYDAAKAGAGDPIRLAGDQPGAADYDAGAPVVKDFPGREALNGAAEYATKAGKQGIHYVDVAADAFVATIRSKAFRSVAVLGIGLGLVPEAVEQYETVWDFVTSSPGDAARYVWDAGVAFVQGHSPKHGVRVALGTGIAAKAIYSTKDDDPETQTLKRTAGLMAAAALIGGYEAGTNPEFFTNNVAVGASASAGIGLGAVVAKEFAADARQNWKKRRAQSVGLEAEDL